MIEHKCKYEWYPALAGEVFGCRECKTITTPEQVIAQLEAELKLRPSVKLSDGDVWLVFPNATISIEGIIQSGRPGPIVTRNLRKWRDELIKKAIGGDDDPRSGAK